jgi:type IV pilus assembly protein PilP
MSSASDLNFQRQPGDGDFKRHIFLVLLALLLTSCQAADGDDLDQFMRDADKTMKVKIEPLPEVTSYVPMQYNADGILTDPFIPRKAINAPKGNLQPNLSRTREPLELYPLENLKFVGSIEQAKLKYALIKTPDGTVQQLKIGNYAGQNFGLVTNIEATGIVLKEIVQDEDSGEWVERDASIALQE